MNLFQDAFAVDHREKGYHHKSTLGNSCHKIHFWDPEREVQRLPPNPPMMDLMMRDNAAYGGYQARKLWSRFEIMLLRVVIDRHEIRAVIKLIDKLSVEEKSATLFLVPTEELRDELTSIGVSSDNIAILHASLYKRFTREMFIVTALYSLSSHAKKIYSIPVDNNRRDSSIFEDLDTNIAVGRIKEQMHPRIDWIYLDGSYNSYMTMKSLYWHISAGNSLETNFLANFTNDRLTESTIIWSWIPEK